MYVQIQLRPPHQISFYATQIKPAIETLAMDNGTSNTYLVGLK